MFVLGLTVSAVSLYFGSNSGTRPKEYKENLDMNSRQLLAIVILLPVLCMGLPSLLMAQSDDWYSHDGNTVEEVISGPAGKLVLLKNKSGEFEFLTSAQASKRGLSISAIGSEQIRLREKGKKVPVQLPILHRNIPLDLLCFAVLRQQNKNVVISAPLKEVKSEYRDFGTGYREELSMMLEIKDSSIVVYTDTALVGSGSASSLPKFYTGGSGSERPVRISAYSITLDGLLKKLEVRTGKKYSHDLDGSQKLSLHSIDLTPNAIVHYLNGLLNTEIRVSETLDSTASAEKVGASKLNRERKRRLVSRAKAAKVFKRVRLLAERGRTKDAALLLNRLIKRSKPSARLFNVQAKLLWKLGAKKKAIKYLKLSIRVDPKNTFARRQLDEIKRKLAQRKSRARG